MQPVYIEHAKPGYVESRALILRQADKPPVFPNLVSATGVVLGPSVPASTKLTTFQARQKVGGKPDWIQDKFWAFLDEQARQALAGAMLAGMPGW